MKKYKITKFPTVLRISGYGYRALDESNEEYNDLNFIEKCEHFLKNVKSLIFNLDSEL